VANPVQRFDIRIADGVDASAAILDAVATRGASEGRPSWTPGSFTGSDSVGMSRLRKDLATGSLHLAWLGGQPVATFSLLESDPMYWPAAGDDASTCTGSPFVATPRVPAGMWSNGLSTRRDGEAAITSVSIAWPRTRESVATTRVAASGQSTRR
jgi:hypothetical protein